MFNLRRPRVLILNRKEKLSENISTHKSNISYSLLVDIIYIRDVNRNNLKTNKMFTLYSISTVKLYTIILTVKSFSGYSIYLVSILHQY